MSTLARIVGGFAIDVITTPPSLEERFAPEWLAAQSFIVVPDGTRHGAKDNGNGTFTNPATTAPPAPAPRAATHIEVIDAIPAAQWLAWRDTADAGAARQFGRLNASSSVSPTEWDQLGDFLQSKGIFTAGQNTTFKAAKPLG